MEALCESDLILTQLIPTVCRYLGQSYFQLVAGIQLIFHSLTSPPNGSTKNGEKTLRLLVLRQWGVFYFSFFFFPYSVLEVTSFLTLLDEVPSIHLLWTDCITVVVTQYSNWVRHWRERAGRQKQDSGIRLICANLLTLMLNPQGLHVNPGKWNLRWKFIRIWKASDHQI